MDRIASLIQEIQHAHQQGADAEVLLSLLQQLQTLLHQSTSPLPQSSKRVAVIMPNPLLLQQENTQVDTINEGASSDVEEEEKIVEVLQVDEAALEAELKQIQEKAAFANQMQAKSSKITPGLLFDIEDDMAELPTFVHQPGSVMAPQGN
ncbi:MAG: hypothetical protein ACK5XN_38135, partial [Bacteroidota bacterium]